jgi:hypothetical protein
LLAQEVQLLILREQVLQGKVHAVQIELPLMIDGASLAGQLVVHVKLEAISE